MSSRGLILYRSILREHKKKLPPVMRKLGDDYIKVEFKLHKEAKPEFLKSFYDGWDTYLNTLKQKKDGKVGINMDVEDRDKLNDEQRQKLIDLKNEALNSLKD
jgi:hypothetical protein